MTLYFTEPLHGEDTLHSPMCFKRIEQLRTHVSRWLTRDTEYVIYEVEAPDNEVDSRYSLVGTYFLSREFINSTTRREVEQLCFPPRTAEEIAAGKAEAVRRQARMRPTPNEWNRGFD